MEHMLATALSFTATALAGAATMVNPQLVRIWNEGGNPDLVRVVSRLNRSGRDRPQTSGDKAPQLILTQSNMAPGSLETGPATPQWEGGQANGDQDALGAGR